MCWQSRYGLGLAQILPELAQIVHFGGVDSMSPFAFVQCVPTQAAYHEAATHLLLGSPSINTPLTQWISSRGPFPLLSGINTISPRNPHCLRAVELQEIGLSTLPQCSSPQHVHIDYSKLSLEVNL